MSSAADMASSLPLQMSLYFHGLYGPVFVVLELLAFVYKGERGVGSFVPLLLHGTAGTTARVVAGYPRWLWLYYVVLR